jgi:hypothetical protein
MGISAYYRKPLAFIIIQYKQQLTPASFFLPQSFGVTLNDASVCPSNLKAPSCLRHGRHHVFGHFNLFFHQASSVIRRLQLPGLSHPLLTGNFISLPRYVLICFHRLFSWSVIILHQTWQVLAFTVFITHLLYF